MANDLLHELRTKIKTWENSWIEMPGQNDEKRKELVEEIQAIGQLNKTTGDEKVASLLEAFASALQEQAKYQDWCSRIDKAVLKNASMRAGLFAERDAAYQVYIENGQEPPDWLCRYFNPRHGPAKRIIETD
jgi:hypothetical protein